MKSDFYYLCEREDAIEKNLSKGSILRQIRMANLYAALYGKTNELVLKGVTPYCDFKLGSCASPTQSSQVKKFVADRQR